MSYKVTEVIWGMNLPPNEKIVLLAFAGYADDEGGNVFPNVKTVATKSGYSGREVRRIMNLLRDRGLLITVEERPGSSNIYRIDLTALPSLPIDGGMTPPTGGYDAPNRGVCHPQQGGYDAQSRGGMTPPTAIKVIESVIEKSENDQGERDASTTLPPAPIAVPPLDDIAVHHTRSHASVTGPTPKAEGLKITTPQPARQSRPAQNDPSSVSKAVRATRIPDDWKPTDTLLAWATAKYPAVDLETATLKFANYWGSKSGSGATKTDWGKTWQNWIIGESERAPQRNNRALAPVGRAGGQDGFTASGSPHPSIPRPSAMDEARERLKNQGQRIMREGDRFSK